MSKTMRAADWVFASVPRLLAVSVASSLVLAAMIVIPIEVAQRIDNEAARNECATIGAVDITLSRGWSQFCVMPDGAIVAIPRVTGSEQ